jgi:hypothetical protein
MGHAGAVTAQRVRRFKMTHDDRGGPTHFPGAALVMTAGQSLVLKDVELRAVGQRRQQQTTVAARQEHFFFVVTTWDN